MNYDIYNGKIRNLSNGDITPEDDKDYIKWSKINTLKEYIAPELPYTEKRKPEYPDIGDQMDAIIKHLNWRRMQGDPLIQDLDDIVNQCLAVKAKYPDPNNK